MNNFSLHLPTKVIFGKGEENNIGKHLKPYASKILLHYGGGSIKQSGLYGRVINSLLESGIQFVELGGVLPNPRLTMVHAGIELCRRENVQMILAVGGGSAIDSAKAIAMGVMYEGDVWDFYAGTAIPKRALPVATILTIPAAGSETSPGSVITNEALERKYGCNCEMSRPILSILNPELCKTLPKNQTANGISDMMAHIMERYFTNTPNVDLTDRMCEAVMRSIIVNGEKLMRDYDSYDNWAEVMWAGSVAHNGILGVGRDESWVSHGIEHELSAIYDIPHGQGLAIIFPAWIKNVYKENMSRFAQFAIRVFDVDMEYNDNEEIIFEGIRRLESFFERLNLPTRLSQINIDTTNFEKMSNSLAKDNRTTYEFAMSVFSAAL